MLPHRGRPHGGPSGAGEADAGIDLVARQLVGAEAVGDRAEQDRRGGRVMRDLQGAGEQGVLGPFETSRVDQRAFSQFGREGFRLGVAVEGSERPGLLDLHEETETRRLGGDLRFGLPCRVERLGGTLQRVEDLAAVDLDARALVGGEAGGGHGIEQFDQAEGSLVTAGFEVEAGAFGDGHAGDGVRVGELAEGEGLDQVEGGGSGVAPPAIDDGGDRGDGRELAAVAGAAGDLAGLPERDHGGLE